MQRFLANIILLLSLRISLLVSGVEHFGTLLVVVAQFAIGIRKSFDRVHPEDIVFCRVLTAHSSGCAWLRSRDACLRLNVTLSKALVDRSCRRSEPIAGLVVILAILAL